MAAMRSVSLTRQLPMLRSRLGPSANSAATAMVIAASGMWLKSASIALSLPRRVSFFARTSLDPVVAHRDLRAHLLESLGKAHIALDAAAPDAFDAHRPAPERPLIAPAARK